MGRFGILAGWRRRLPLVLVAAMAMVSPLAMASPAQAAVTSPGGYTSLAPARLLDTRSALGVPTTTPVAPGGTVSLQVLGRGDVPASGVSAVVLNVTVAGPTSSGYVTVYGDGTTRPTASNLNFVKDQVVPNLVVAPVGANGKVALFNGSPGTTHLVADVSGYFLSGTPTVAGSFASLAPSRLLDTRSGLGASTAAVAPGGTVSLQVTGRGGVPGTGGVPSAVVLNVTVAEPTASGYVTAYGDETTRPTASNLNYVKDQVVPNLVVAPVGANGKVALYNGSPGTVQLIADVSGYFLPGTPAAAGALRALAPSRLLDTRSGLGAPTAAAVAAGGTVSLQVAGRGGVPASGASAVVLNVTVAAPTSSGYVTVYGDETTRPTASNLNYVKDQVVPNLVIAPVGDNGKVALYNGSPGTVHLVADVSGWFSSTSAVPGPVTGVSAIPASTSIALSWTNPTSESFSGVMVRRLAGATPPASAYDGDLVTDAASPAISFNDTGLTTGVQYTYALFAHNGDPGYAVAVTVTATTTPAGTGAVSGLVTDAGDTHQGLEGVAVRVYTPSSGGHTYTTTTAADGGYTVSGLAPATDYQVCFTGAFATGGSSDETGYIDQCWQNQPTTGTPTPVAVTTVATRTGINAALVGGGAISGLVTDAGGTHHGLANVVVQVSSPSTGTRPGVSTAADGSYTAQGLPAGTAYRVCFQSSGATGGSSDPTGYVDQCWQNQPTVLTATPVSVTLGTTRTGINAALAGAGAVTNVTAIPSTYSIALSWTNPNGPSLAGVMIRRAPGETAPASVTDGVLVADVAKPAATYTDAGLTSGTQYSYALFAHNGTPIYAASATVTTTTLITVAMISTGSTHSCAVTTAGGVKCWGYNGSGELGNGTTTSSLVPVDVVGLGPGSGVVTVSAGESHTCAVTSSGAVRCWGFGRSGELGNGTTTGSSVPVGVVGLGSGSGAAAVSAGGSHSCAVTSSGAVRCWGFNAYGQLGDGSLTDRAAPVDVAGLGPGAVAVSAGGSHTCAVAAGAVKCWGSGGSGELGNGTTTSSSAPVGVTGLGSGMTVVSAGSGYTCASTSTGAVRCWGSNDYGQLGNGNTTSTSAPVGVTGLGSGVAAVSAGGYHSCAVTSAGAAKCWGSNGDGQLGNATTNDSAVPVDVFGLR